jgi:hypothetical protein
MCGLRRKDRHKEEERTGIMKKNEEERTGIIV